MMNETLPGQVRSLMAEVYRDSATNAFGDGYLKSNNSKRDLHFLRECSIEVITHDLPRLGKLLDQHLAKGTESEFSVESVEDGCQPIPQALFKVFVKGVHDHDPQSVRSLRQILHLMSKLEMSFASSEEAIASFVDRNSRLPGTVSVDVIARQIAHLILGNLDLRDIVPKHGPGAVSTGEAPKDKMQFKRMYSTHQDHYPVTDYFFLNNTHLCDYLQDLYRFEVVDHPVAKLVAVPKDFRGPRLISCEPVENQWLQQGQLRQLVEHLETKCSITRGFVNFSSQEVNRNLAVRSSIDQRYVTLDLKDASDMVSLSLVRGLFPKGLLSQLEATRSLETMLPDGTKIPLNMFSPMGSAVCFPIESVVFYSIALAAVHRCMFSHALTPKTLKKVLGTVYTYGDDLIILAPYGAKVIEALTHHHLKVNDAKCCTGPRFRESCGMDAYMGVDVTPCRVKRFPDRRSPTSYSSSIDYINQLGKKGLWRASAYLLDVADDCFGGLPRSTRGELGIKVRFAAEAMEYNLQHFKFRYNRDIQRTEFLVPTLKQVVCQPKSSTVWSELFRAVLLCTDTKQGYPIPHRVRLTKRWRSL